MHHLSLLSLAETLSVGKQEKIHLANLKFKVTAGPKVDFYAIFLTSTCRKELPKTPF